jgi:hypothetical protein
MPKEEVMDLRIFLCAIMALGLLAVSICRANVPNHINFQGTLTDTSGHPVTGAQIMQFSLFTDSTGGSALWSEAHSSVNVANGLFRVVLGSATQFPDVLFEYQELWMQTTVGGEILSPRQKLTSVPYGFRAKDADHASWADSSSHAIGVDTANYALTADTAAWSIDGTHAANADISYIAYYALNSGLLDSLDSSAFLSSAAGSIVDSMIADDQVVKSINSLRDDVTVSGRTNVSVATSNDSIIISGIDGSEYFWTLTGNSGTTPATNFIGTLDNQELQIKVNNRKVMTFYPNATAPNIIAGCYQNTTLNGVIGATISGGGDAAMAANSVTDRFGTVGGGRANGAGDGLGTVWDGMYATVGGGSSNLAAGKGSVISGGEFNEAQGDYSVISGGQYIDAVGNFSVGGGYAGYASGSYGTVAGGQNCRAEASQSSVCGGGYNWSTSTGAAICGGNSNRANGSLSAIIGGQGNQANGDYSVTAGGYYNITDTTWATVGGGRNNTVTAECGTISGGCASVVDGNYGTVGGGSNNIAHGIASTVPGGMDNLAEGDYAAAMGRQAKAVNDGSFVWADGSGQDFATTSNNQFLIRAQGGVGIGTNSPQQQLDVAGNIRAAGNMECIALNQASDIRLKADIIPINDALCKIEQLQGVTFRWNQNGESLGGKPGEDQIGVIAQDVEQVFPELVSTGENGYKSVDYTKLTAVLIEAVKELQARVEKLEIDNRDLREHAK